MIQGRAVQCEVDGHIHTGVMVIPGLCIKCRDSVNTVTEYKAAITPLLYSGNKDNFSITIPFSAEMERQSPVLYFSCLETRNSCKVFF